MTSPDRHRKHYNDIYNKARHKKHNKWRNVVHVWRRRRRILGNYHHHHLVVNVWFEWWIVIRGKKKRRMK
jgi:hypothetical protein